MRIAVTVGVPTSGLRIATYNVHGCRGSDGRLDPRRIGRVIEACRADAVALQELDAGQDRSRGLDQTAFLAEQLDMAFSFTPARKAGNGHFGNAWLSKRPHEAVRFSTLPGLPRLEPRAAQWIRLDAGWGTLHLINTHLGLTREEQSLQTEALLGSEWLGNPEMGDDIVLCGDLNFTARTGAHLAIQRVLKDAQLSLPRRPRPTFPALWPMLRIDHVFVSKTLEVTRAEVPAGLARLASDHRPLHVEIRRKDRKGTA
jgi:endonuclease/exonuclease/phosphatase family metal-dependent hydrolase